MEREESVGTKSSSEVSVPKGQGTLFGNSSVSCPLTFSTTMGGTYHENDLVCTPTPSGLSELYKSDTRTGTRMSPCSVTFLSFVVKVEVWVTVSGLDRIPLT